MSIIKTIRRDIGGVIRSSINLGESSVTKMRRALWSAVYLVKAVKLSVSAMRQEQLGSMVRYRGQTLFICNWAGSPFPTLSGPGVYFENVPRNEVVNVVSLREMYHRFDARFSWYMSSWYGIDINRRIYGAIKSDV